MRKKASLTLFLLLFSLTLLGQVSAQSEKKVYLKARTVNPFDEEKSAIVKFDLPREVSPEDIIDIGEFELRYNFEKSCYYVYRKVKLKAGESIVSEVVLRDIWRIPEQELSFLSEYSKELLGFLEGTEYLSVGKDLVERVKEQIEEIKKKQDDLTLSVREHIAVYYKNLSLLEQVREDIKMLEELVKATGRVLKKGVEKEVEEVLKEKKGGGIIRLNIEAKNPTDKPQVVSFRRLLPQEIELKDILDHQDLGIGYDFDSQSYYVFKDDLKLEAQEKRRFVVEIRDVWTIAEERLRALESKAERLRKVGEGGLFSERIRLLYEDIVDGLREIRETQEKNKVKNVGVEKHIGAYRDNIRRLREVEKTLSELERLVKSTSIGGSTWKKTGKKEKFPGAKGLRVVAESIFRGKMPTKSAVWKIIFTIIKFVGLVSLLFFLLQFRQHRQAIFDALTGTFAREYIISRCTREMEIARQKKIKCSFLLLDNDRFKEINDEYGHPVGDSVLREFVLTIRKALRREDIIGRLGGDEFLIFLPNTDKAGAGEIAEKVKRALNTHSFRIKGNLMQITASIGVATYPDDSDTFEEIFKKLDSAMYKAKAEGGNRIAYV